MARCLYPYIPMYTPAFSDADARPSTCPTRVRHSVLQFQTGYSTLYVQFIVHGAGKNGRNGLTPKSRWYSSHPNSHKSSPRRANFIISPLQLSFCVGNRRRKLTHERTPVRGLLPCIFCFSITAIVYQGGMKFKISVITSLPFFRQQDFTLIFVLWILQVLFGMIKREFCSDSS